MTRNLQLVRLAVALLVLAATAVGSASASRQSAASSGSQSVGLTAGIDWRAPVNAGETFYTATAYDVVSYGQRIVRAGSPDGTAKTLVGDQLILTVRRPNGTEATYWHDYCASCGTPLRPLDITSLFGGGVNSVTLTLRNNCGGDEGSSPIWIAALPVLP
jgi:hypothetical protein